jgi:anti-sigma B factor antagonist
MNITTSQVNGISVVHVSEARLTYPLLTNFVNTVTGLITSGEQRILINLETVSYVDSATIGCLMDLYRQSAATGGALKLAGVQKRVETMLTMTGAHNFLEVHADQASAIASFGA